MQHESSPDDEALQTAHREETVHREYCKPLSSQSGLLIPGKGLSIYLQMPMLNVAVTYRSVQITSMLSFRPSMSFLVFMSRKPQAQGSRLRDKRGRAGPLHTKAQFQQTSNSSVMVCASETLPFVGSACGPRPLMVGYAQLEGHTAHRSL